MERGRRHFAVAVGATMALGLLLPSTAPALDRTISVEGTATQQVPNDAASVGLSVSVERRARQAALRAVAVRLRAVIATAQTIPGVGEGDVITGTITVREVSRGERKIFRAAEGVAVILHQPERAGELITAAIAAGATGTRGPSFFASDPEAAYRNTLLVAFDQAKAKAAALAARAGATLGPAITIDEGTDVTYAPSQTAGPRRRKEDEPTPPTKPGASAVTATVRVVFSLL